MRRAFLSLALVACLAAGCGSDDDSGDKVAGAQTGTQTGTSTGTQTAAAGSSKARRRFIAKADAICERASSSARRLNTRAQKAVQGASSETAALKRAAPVIAKGAATQARYQRQLHELEPPQADRQAWSKMLQDTDRLVTVQQTMAAAARAGDAERFLATRIESGRVRTTVHSAAQDYGFKECGSES